eukprot:gene10695-10852_t
MAPQKTSSDTTNVLPVFDLSGFLALKQGEVPAEQLVQQCVQLADCLSSTGCVVVRDPRVATSDNDTFLDLLEQYFSRPAEEKMQDVGATPSGIEVPRCLAEPEGCQQQLQQLAPDAQPVLPTGPDVKWRFMWRVGPRPAETQYAELNADPVIPRGLPSWPMVMDGWGSKLVAAVDAVAAMAAVGFGLPQNAFRDLMLGGPHLLAPTGSDLAAHGKAGTVLAGFHYDLNFITIHGRSRFPGLSVWLADGRKLPVAIPPGCLLCQAGKQLEWLTGGHVRAGMHETVFCSPWDTLQEQQRPRLANTQRCPPACRAVQQYGKLFDDGQLLVVAEGLLNYRTMETDYDVLGLAALPNDDELLPQIFAPDFMHMLNEAEFLDEDPEERRKQRRLAKNRVTAARSRERKKEQVADLSARLNSLESDNHQLRDLLATLLHENTSLKEQLASLTRGRVAAQQQFVVFSVAAVAAVAASVMGAAPPWMPHNQRQAVGQGGSCDVAGACSAAGAKGAAVDAVSQRMSCGDGQQLLQLVVSRCRLKERHEAAPDLLDGTCGAGAVGALGCRHWHTAASYKCSEVLVQQPVAVAA